MPPPTKDGEHNRDTRQHQRHEQNIDRCKPPAQAIDVAAQAMLDGAQFLARGKILVTKLFDLGPLLGRKQLLRLGLPWLTARCAATLKLLQALFGVGNLDLQRLLLARKARLSIAANALDKFEWPFRRAARAQRE